VHVLAKLRPDRALSDVLRDLKANATGWMHDVFPVLKDCSWQRGYGAFISHSKDSFIGVATRVLFAAKQHLYSVGRGAGGLRT
jgi:hypothetical protein